MADESKPVMAYHVPARDAVRISVGQWSTEFPRADLDGWIAFYARMAKRKGGRLARHYNPTLHALEGVRRSIDSKGDRNG